MTKVLDQASGNGWSLINGDSVEVVGGMPDASADFCIYSPPFVSLYTFSNSNRDMSNVRDEKEFTEHFGHLTPNLLRVLKPGRLMAVHCMQLVTTKSHHGYIGLYDFRGELVRMMQAEGFIFHSEITIWKNPVTAMQRTKALGLLHKQIKKDSTMSRQGTSDYLLIFRTPGTNPDPVSHTDDTFPVERWQRYASPVWATIDGVDDEGFATFRDPRKGDEEHEASGISPTETLQYMSAREGDDERHISPLQLGVIRRAVRLWTNKGDVVLSPFAGIGSEGHVAIQEGRRFIGCELKRSYFRLAARNLQQAEPQAAGKNMSLFANL